jgi:hypothetical protein
LTAARAVIPGLWAIPPKNLLEDHPMNTMLDTSFVSRASAFAQPLTLDALRERAPAVFASGAHERTSSKYTFICKCGQPHLQINVVTDHMWRWSTASLIPAQIAPASAT